MNILSIILAVSALTALAYLVMYVVALVKDDGYARLGGRRNPPASHYPDQFDPRRFA